MEVGQLIVGDSAPINQLRYATDGTLEGLLTALYQAFQQKESPANIVIDEEAQTALFNSDVPILTDIQQAEAMQELIIDRLQAIGYDKVKRLYLSEHPQRGGIAYRFLEYSLPKGPPALGDLAQPAVADAEEIIRQVQKEAHYMTMFIRFADVGRGLFYSHIRPQASVVPLLMNHFAARFNIQPFIIHDSRHCLSGVFDTRRWWLVEGVPAALNLSVAEQDHFEALWQRFYKTIAIPERRNPVVQRGFMPKRFWGDMCEQQQPYTKRGSLAGDAL